MWDIIIGWIWLIIIIILVVVQVVGGLKQIGTPLFWIGKQIAIMCWKHRKMWPIEVKNIGKSAQVIYKPASNSFEIVVDVGIRVRKKDAKSKIDKVEMELTDNEHIWKCDEYIPTDLVDLFPSITKLTDKKLIDLADGKYTLAFGMPYDNYFKEWYNGKIALDIHGVIKIEAEGLSCETKPQIIANGKQS